MTMLDTTDGAKVFSSADLTPAQYHREFPDYISRSTAHQIYRHGGLGQMLLDEGIPLFTGNAGTSKGSQFDYLWEQRATRNCRIDQLFVMPPASVLTSNGQRRGKAYDEWKAEVAASGQQEASAEDISRMHLMWRACELNQAAMDLLDETTDCQRSVFWTDRRGHKRKALWDGATRELVYDVKTTSSPIGELAKSFLSFGYFWQAGWYSDSAYATGYLPFRMPFICVQTVPPYHCKVVLCPDQMVDEARDQIDRTLDAIALRRETGEYLPEGYGEVCELECPGWMWKQEVYGDE